MSRQHCPGEDPFLLHNQYGFELYQFNGDLENIHVGAPGAPLKQPCVSISLPRKETRLNVVLKPRASFLIAT